jgi:hypothetical protein
VDRTESTGSQLVSNPTETAQLTVEVGADDKIRFAIWGVQPSEKKEIPAGTNQAEEVKAHIAAIKVKYPYLKQAIVVSDPGVNYGGFVKAADLIRKDFKLMMASPEASK